MLEEWGPVQVTLHLIRALSLSFSLFIEFVGAISRASLTGTPCLSPHYAGLCCELLFYLWEVVFRISRDIQRTELEIKTILFQIKACGLKTNVCGTAAVGNDFGALLISSLSLQTYFYFHFEGLT